MSAKGILLAAALLAGGSAQAQGLEPPPASPLAAEAGGRYGPLAKGFKRYQPLYGGNEAANPNDRLFPGFRTDPRLVIGYAFTPYLALEGGYSHLRDEGFHKFDPYDPAEAAVSAGALGVKSHATYVAGKLTVPLTERLTAYGKLGVSQSTLKGDGFTRPELDADRTSTGPYGAVGARYRLNDRATLKGEVRMNGSADKFGRASNDSGVRGSVGFGF